MALINCPECNKEISDKAQVCPHCGYDLLESTQDSPMTKDVYWKKADNDKSPCPACGKSNWSSPIRRGYHLQFSIFGGIFGAIIGAVIGLIMNYFNGFPWWHGALILGAICCFWGYGGIVKKCRNCGKLVSF